MKKASKKKSILKGIIDFGMYNTLEERLRNSPEYKKSRKRVGKALKKLDDLGLSEEQMDVIDDVLTVCNENAAIYGRKAYIQGFTYPDGTAKSRTSRPEDYIKRIFACRKRQGNTGGRKAE